MWVYVTARASVQFIWGNMMRLKLCWAAKKSRRFLLGAAARSVDGFHRQQRSEIRRGYRQWSVPQNIPREDGGSDPEAVLRIERISSRLLAFFRLNEARALHRVLSTREPHRGILPWQLSPPFYKPLIRTATMGDDIFKEVYMNFLLILLYSYCFRLERREMTSRNWWMPATWQRCPSRTMRWDRGNRENEGKCVGALLYCETFRWFMAFRASESAMNSRQRDKNNRILWKWSRQLWKHMWAEYSTKPQTKV